MSNDNKSDDRLYAMVTLNTYAELEAIFRNRDLFPEHDEKIMQAGFQNIVIGVAPPTLFRHTITLMVMP